MNALAVLVGFLVSLSVCIHRGEHSETNDETWRVGAGIVGGAAWPLLLLGVLLYLVGRGAHAGIGRFVKKPAPDDAALEAAHHEVDELLSGVAAGTEGGQ